MAFKKIIDWATIPGHESATAPTSGELGLKSNNWTEFTMGCTGFGTVTRTKARFRRHGPDILVRGQFQTGTTTATEARCSLPSGITSASTIGNAAASGFAYELAGRCLTEQTSGDACVLIEPSKTYVTFGKVANGQVFTTKVNGSTLVGNTKYVIFECRIPVSGYEI
jgi:hypothetical protein